MAHKIVEIGTSEKAARTEHRGKKSAQRREREIGGAAVKGEDEPTEQNGKQRGQMGEKWGNGARKAGKYKLFRHQQQEVVDAP